jgi:hypothetical protein
MRHERQLSHFFQPCLILILVLDLDFFQPTTLDASCLIVLSKYIMAYLNLYHITADTADGTRDARIIWAQQWLVCGVWRQCGVHPAPREYEYVVERKRVSALCACVWYLYL